MLHFTPGQICYLQIPALDVVKSAAFYAKIFGWEIDGQSSFTAPGLIGQWVTDRRPSLDAGLMVWIDVASIDKTLELVRANGGEVVSPPEADGPRWLATIRDPSGNAIGIVQHGAR